MFYISAQHTVRTGLQTHPSHVQIRTHVSMLKCIHLYAHTYAQTWHHFKIFFFLSQKLSSVDTYTSTTTNTMPHT